MTEVTQIINKINDGDPTAASQLLPLVYDELRALARRRLAQERPGQTLQATALVHEAYLRLTGGNPNSNWDSRGHFFAAAAEAMRRILVEQARRKLAQKRGGGARPVPFDSQADIAVSNPMPIDDLIALDEALREFEAIDAARANVVKLHYFAGLSLAETAEALEISLATVKRRWVYARCWLFGKIRDKE